MVRVMSLLPFATGSLCLLLVLVSFFGFASGTIDDEIPALPCVGTQDECATGMSESDLDVPNAFFLLDVHLDISMELDDAAWIGIVDAEYAESCPPGETGLTNCTASDYEFLRRIGHSSPKRRYVFTKHAYVFTKSAYGSI